MYFSDCFEIDAKVLEDYGAINISLVCDIPLFIDPMLIFANNKEEYQKLHIEIIDFFLYLKEQSDKPNSENLLMYLFGFPEIKNNWLGYSKEGNGGSGNGKKFARVLYDNIGSISNTKEISKSVHIERLNLINEGVGKDKISDMVTNISLKFLLEYTQNFAKKYIDQKFLRNFKVDRVYFDYQYEVFKADYYTLPFITNNKGKKEYVLLTPSEILRADEPAINLKRFKNSYEEVIPMIENNGLRALVNRHIADSIKKAENEASSKKKISQTQINKISRNAFFEVVDEYPELYDYFIKYMETESKNITLESKVERNRIVKRFVDNIICFVEKFEYALPRSVAKTL